MHIPVVSFNRALWVVRQAIVNGRDILETVACDCRCEQPNEGCDISIVAALLAGGCFLLKYDKRTHVDEKFVNSVYKVFEDICGKDSVQVSNGCYNFIAQRLMFQLKKHDKSNAIIDAAFDWICAISLKSSVPQLADDRFRDQLKMHIRCSLEGNLDYTIRLWRFPGNPWNDDESFRSEVGRFAVCEMCRPVAIDLRPFFHRFIGGWINRNPGKFYTILCFMPVVVLAIHLWCEKCAEDRVEESCMNFLRGRVYCRHCGRQHSIESIEAKHKWKDYGDDEGWIVYVHPKIKGEVIHDTLGFHVYKKGNVVTKLVFDECCTP